MTSNEHISRLLERYRQDLHTPEEYQELLDYFGKEGEREKAHDALFKALSEDQNRSPVSRERIDRVTDAAYERLQERLGQSPSFWKRLLPYAAAFLLVSSLGIYYYEYQRRNLVKEQNSFIPVKDALPGTSGGTLTLSDGNKIPLATFSGKYIRLQTKDVKIDARDGQLIYSETEKLPGKTKIDNAATNYNTLTTANAQTYRINLPDGSLAWLNAGSSLTYPTSFEGKKERRVSLSGEAYFEISHNKAKPFIVSTKGQEVRVLGTHFNIKAYPSEHRESTTLARGSVRVTLKKDAFSDENPAPSGGIILSPGQQSINDGQLAVTACDLATELSWTRGNLKFKGAPLQSILSEASRWYDFDIEYRSAPSGEHLTGGISRKANLSVLLKVLALNGVHCALVEKNKRKLLIVNP